MFLLPHVLLLSQYYHGVPLQVQNFSVCGIDGESGGIIGDHRHKWYWLDDTTTVLLHFFSILL